MSTTEQFTDPLPKDPLARKDYVYAANPSDDWATADPRCVLAGKQVSKGRIMPDEYQPHHLRLQRDMLLVQDDFLAAADFALARRTGELAAKMKGYGHPMDVIGDSPDESLRPVSENYPFRSELPDDECAELAAGLEALIGHVHQFMKRFTRPNAIRRYHGWINTGPIPGGMDLLRPEHEFHFWHYDSDVALEFDRQWVRFPVWGSILYIHQPEGMRHYTQMDTKSANQRISARPNRFVLLDPRYLHRVTGPETREDENLRTVFVVNAWDYLAPERELNQYLGKDLLEP